MEKKKVLIIDDEQSFLEITKINLENTGEYKVAILSEAKDIISQIHAFQPDIILLDILMPKIDGVEACRMLNNDQAGKGTPIIILSALDADKDKLMMYKLGVVDFIIKPVEIRDLIAAIEKALKCK